MMQLAVRMLLLEAATNRTLRIVHVEPGVYWLHRLGDVGWPAAFSAELLQRGINTGEWICKAEDLPTLPTTEAAVARHDRRYALVEPLLRADMAWALVGPKRFDVMKARVQELGRSGTKTSYQQISKLVHAWWDCGMTYDALATKYDRCGGPGKRKRNVGKKVGRPRFIGPGVGINTQEKTSQQLQIACNMYLMGKSTIAQAYRSMCMNYFSEVVTDEAGRPKRVLLQERPTPGQFIYYLRTRYPATVRRRLRRGEHAYELTSRPVTGKADYDVKGPGDRYEIDATIADTYLVSAFDPMLIVGRPVIYSVIDVYSRMIVGIYVGFEGPSWIGAMMALVNMVTNKAEFCLKYEIEIGPDEWPCHHAPVEIMADRGELMSSRLGKKIVNDLNIGITNVRAYRGDMKGIVERTHRTLPRIWKAYNPGYVEPDFGERGAIDYREKGALTLHEFTKQYLLSVLVHNATPNGGRGATPEMVSAGLTASPIDYWRWGVENLGPRLHHLTVDQVALAVMPSGEATVYPNGIRFKGAHYDCAKAQLEQWYERARHDGTWRIEVTYDPRDLTRLYLRTASKAVEILNLFPSYGEREGKSLFEVEEQDLRAKKATAAGEDERIANRAEREATMKEIGDAGRKRLALAIKTTPDVGKRTKNIRDNRASEKAAQRKVEVFAPGRAEPVRRLPVPADPLKAQAQSNLAQIAKMFPKDNTDKKS